MHKLRAARPTAHPSSIGCTGPADLAHASLRVVRPLPYRTTRWPTSSAFPPCTLPALQSWAAHREQAVRQPAVLFRTLDGALTDFFLCLAPRYGRARTREAIERGAEYGRSSVSFILCCGSSFRFVDTQYSGVEPTCARTAFDDQPLIAQGPLPM